MTENLDLEAVLNWLMGPPLRIVIILFVAWLVLRLGGRTIRKVLARLAEGGRTHHNADSAAVAAARRRERALTTGSVLKSTLNFTVILVATAMILGELGLNLAPIVASAGIVGVAVGLGSQSLVKDFISGLFLIMEDQYGVGDKVTIDGVEGIVESVGLRSTTVRTADGVLWFIRNGEIQKVGNASAQ